MRCGPHVRNGRVGAHSTYGQSVQPGSEQREKRYTDQARRQRARARMARLLGRTRHGAVLYAIFFLRMPMNFVFSSSVWKRPWPNFDEVSMNLMVISSAALRLVCSKSALRRVMMRFFGPTTQPLRTM